MENKYLECMAECKRRVDERKSRKKDHITDSLEILKGSKRFIIDDVDGLIDFGKVNRADNLMLPFKSVAIETQGLRKDPEKNWIGDTVTIVKQVSDKEISLAVYSRINAEKKWDRLMSEITVKLNDRGLFDIGCRLVGPKLKRKEKTATQQTIKNYAGSLTAVVFGLISFLQREPNEIVSSKQQRDRNPSTAKLPASADAYMTVVLDPTKRTKGKSKGGTHASPRAHERRGFWRTSKCGVKHWVGPTIVNPSAGAMVVKDYVISTSSAA